MTQVAFKNCAPFKTFKTEINNTFLDEAEELHIATYKLIEYSDNYSYTFGSLWSLKRDEIKNNAYVSNDNNAPSFKDKAIFIGDAKKKWNKRRCKNSCTIKTFE